MEIALTFETMQMKSSTLFLKSVTKWQSKMAKHWTHPELCVVRLNAPTLNPTLQRNTTAGLFFIPFIDCLINQLKERFTGKNNDAIKECSLFLNV